GRSRVALGKNAQVRFVAVWKPAGRTGRYPGLTATCGGTLGARVAGPLDGGKRPIPRRRRCHRLGSGGSLAAGNGCPARFAAQDGPASRCPRRRRWVAAGTGAATALGDSPFNAGSRGLEAG